MENTIQILNNIIVPEADNTITESAQLAVALPVFGAFRVLAAVEFDNQTPLAANKIDVVSIDRFLADEFKATQLPASKVCPQRELRGR